MYDVAANVPLVNMRQRYEAILKAEGLGELDFSSRSFVSSAAAEHEARTTGATKHYRDPDALALIEDILAECALPEAHRAVLYRFMRGDPVRKIAARAGISKDTVDRLILRYIGNETSATVAEVSPIRAAVPLDPRRVRCATGTKPHRRPLSASGSVVAYYDLGAIFAAQHNFRWQRDREIWALHIGGMSRRRIAREIGMPDRTTQKAIERVRQDFVRWLKSRPHDNDSDQAQIGAMFECFSNHQRY